MNNENKFTAINAMVLVLIIIVAQFVLALGLSFGYGFVMKTVYSVIAPEKIARMATHSWIYLSLAVLLGQGVILFVFQYASRKFEFSFNRLNISSKINFLLVLLLGIFGTSFVLISSELENMSASLMGRYPSFGAPIHNLALAEGIPGFIWAILLVALIPAVCEELFFRGFLQNKLCDEYGPNRGLIISTLIFSLMHVNPTFMVSVFLSALIMGYVYQKSGHLIYPIILHFLNNLATVLIMRFKIFHIKGLYGAYEGVEHIEKSIAIPAWLTAILTLYLINTYLFKEKDTQADNKDAQE